MFHMTITSLAAEQTSGVTGPGSKKLSWAQKQKKDKKAKKAKKAGEAEKAEAEQGRAQVATLVAEVAAYSVNEAASSVIAVSPDRGVYKHEMLMKETEFGWNYPKRD